MKKEEQNKRKNLVFLIVGVLTLLVAIIGATYAFFQAQTGASQDIDVSAQTGTTDNLTFTIADIDVTEPVGDGISKNIIDNHNKILGGDENTELAIIADANNFGAEGTSLGDGVEATATLIANNTTKEANATYNVYLVLDQNDLVYTMNEQTPELLLTIKEPGVDTEYTQIVTPLEHHIKDKDNPKDIDGFDITGQRNVIEIAKEYNIDVNSDTPDLTTTQTWEIQITLVNLNVDQNKNTGKSITGKVLITTADSMELSYINSVEISRTEDSITAAINDDANLKEYYFGIEKENQKSTDFTNYEKAETNTKTFDTLELNTEYVVYSYAVDNNGFKTNMYETSVRTGTGELPKIESVEVSSVSSDSLTVNVTPGTLSSYEYTIIDGEYTKGTTSSSANYKFNALKANTSYTISIVGIDSNGEKTAAYYLQAKTLATDEVIEDPACLEGENIQTCLTRIDKEQHPSVPALILHDGASDYSGETNYAEEAGDYSYRYMGASPNNYVCFGGDCSDDYTSDGYLNLYRIIGLFPTDTSHSTYQLKLIRADYATTTELGAAGVGSFTNLFPDADNEMDLYQGNTEYLNKVGSYVWNKNGTINNDWIQSKLNNENLNNYFVNTYLGGGLYNINSNPNKWQNMIVKHTWMTTGNDRYKVNYTKPKDAYTNEMISPYIGDSTPDASPTVTNYVGLMYINDYAYASDQKNWTKRLDYGEFLDNDDGYDSSEQSESNWLYLGLGEWLLTRLSTGQKNVYILASDGADVSIAGADGDTALRQTFYLKSTVKIASGDGTINNPFTLM